MPKPSENNPHITVKNKSLQLKKDLIAIAQNSGFTTLNAYICNLLFKTRDSAPKNMLKYE